MKANELMIGDWVECTYWTPSKLLKVAEVRRIMDDEIKIGVYSDDLVLIFRQSEVNPIPLTPEILEKNGFEDIGDDIYQLEEKPCWFWVDFFRHTYGCEYDTSTYEYEDDEHRLKLYGIPSVHQLQQALRLCGINHEIIL